MHGHAKELAHVLCRFGKGIRFSKMPPMRTKKNLHPETPPQVLIGGILVLNLQCAETIK